jgi:phosphatidylglycerol:prolipoprotein diacylglycerol transferase
MRQTLFYIPEFIGDVPVFGVGLLLGIFLVVSIVVLVSLCRRPNTRSDAWGYLPILALGVGVCFILPILCEERGLPIRGYGTFMLLAVVISTAVAAWRGHRLGVNPEKVVTLIFWGFVPGIIGARLYYVIQYWDNIKQNDIGATLLQIANIPDGGLVVYGGFIGAGRLSC